MAYVEQAADYITGDVVTASEYNQTMSNIIYNHDTSRAFKNRLINGNFIVNEYSGVFSGTLAAATEAYVIDRWYAEATGGTPAGARAAGSGDRKYHYQFTGAASVSALKFGQRIEAANIQDLASTTVIISVYLANSVLTSVGWAVTYADSEDDFSSVTAIDSGSWTVDSTMTRYTAEVDLPAGAANGIQLELSVGAQTSGTWTIGNVQLEAGDTVTDFDVRNVGTETNACQWYAKPLIVSHIIGTSVTTTRGYMCTHFTTMRSAPTVTLVTSAVTQLIRPEVAVYSGAYSTTFSVTRDSLLMTIDRTSGDSFTAETPLRINAPSGSKVFLNSEL